MVEGQMLFRHPSSGSPGRTRNPHRANETMGATDSGRRIEPTAASWKRFDVTALTRRLRVPGNIPGFAGVMLLVYVLVTALPFSVFASDKDAGAEYSPSKEALLVDARAYIQHMGDRSYQAMTANPVGSSTRSAQLAALMIEAMDFPALSRFSLGRAARRIKGQSFEEYTRLFATHFIDIATDRLKEAEPSGFSITSARLLPNNDVLVTTAIAHTAGDDFEAAWRVRRHGDGLKAVDVFVQGASVAQHFRNRFADWISKAGVGGIIKKLESLTKDSPHLALVRSDLKLAAGS